MLSSRYDERIKIKSNYKTLCMTHSQRILKWREKQIKILTQSKVTIIVFLNMIFFFHCAFASIFLPLILYFSSLCAFTYFKWYLLLLWYRDSKCVGKGNIFLCFNVIYSSGIFLSLSFFSTKQKYFLLWWSWLPHSLFFLFSFLYFW